MSVVRILEYDRSRAKEMFKEHVEFYNEVMIPYLDKLKKDKDINMTVTSWADDARKLDKLNKDKDIKMPPTRWDDDAGHVVTLVIFETVEDYVKLMRDDKWHDMEVRMHFYRCTYSMRTLFPYQRLLFFS